MVRRLLAGFALLVITAWAAIFPLPMFAVHSMHRHLADTVQSAAHHHAGAGAHACCPGFKAVPVAPSIEFKAGSEPCAEQHRCCVGQAPQSAPAPARESHQPSPDFHVIQALAPHPVMPSRFAVSAHIEPSLSPPIVLGMIRRV